MNAKASPELAEQYAELAARIDAAPQQELWEAFGSEMDEMRRDADHEADFVGYVVNANPHHRDGTPLAQMVTVRTKQTGASRSSLIGGPLASAVDVYAVVPRYVENPVEAFREAVADGLRRYGRQTDFDAELADTERLEAYQPTPSGAVIQLVALEDADHTEAVRVVDGDDVVTLYEGHGMRPAQVYNRTVDVFTELEKVDA